MVSTKQEKESHKLIYTNYCKNQIIRIDKINNKKIIQIDLLY